MSDAEMERRELMTVILMTGEITIVVTVTMLV